MVRSKQLDGGSVRRLVLRPNHRPLRQVLGKLPVGTAVLMPLASPVQAGVLHPGATVTMRRVLFELDSLSLLSRLHISTRKQATTSSPSMVVSIPEMLDRAPWSPPVISHGIRTDQKTEKVGACASTRFRIPPRFRLPLTRHSLPRPTCRLRTLPRLTCRLRPQILPRLGCRLHRLRGHLDHLDSL